MTRMQRYALLTLSLLLVVTLSADDVLAQGRRSGGGGGGTRPPIEISATYGSMWGGNVSLYSGKIRTATGPSINVSLEVPIQPGMAVQASWTGQDGALDWDSVGGKTKLTDMSVNYWQIGAVRSLAQGKVIPFISTSLGATYYSPTESTVTIEDEEYRLESMTKFSFVLGLGAKTFFGENERFGLRATFKVLPTLYNTGGGVWFGTGGASLGVTGNAIWQWEGAVGVTVKLG